MDAFQQLLLVVWQDACRHSDIGLSTDSIAVSLRQQLPIRQVLVRRIDPARSCLETVAVGPAEQTQLPDDARTDCTAKEMEAILAWCRQRKIVHRENAESIAPELGRLLFSNFNGDIIAGPLGNSSGHNGLLILQAAEGSTFAPDHLALAQLLLEPFSVSLENDLRLRQMAALSEAAEADKRSLLARLGRKTLGDTIVGVETGLRGVMERVGLVAPSDAPVLIFGETGTGKELVARSIHNRSSRHQGPFHRVNCGAIPPELIDSQLFGHERGAFTGAVESRRGWFERADGGTLFLDEIGELPPAAQVRMLRILQDGWMERVGGEKPINVDVRIIAATHRDLASMVAEGRFREDLWYRIAVFPIVIPPLRERREDIARIAAHFAERAATRFSLAPVAPTPEDLKLLMSYPWPGNVRELGAVIDRAAILGDGKRLEVAKALGVDATSLHKAATSGRDSGWNNNLAANAAETADSGHLLSLNEAIQRHIETALRMARGRIEGRQGAAALLKINPHTLRAKMRKLGIDWSRFREEA